MGCRLIWCGLCCHGDENLIFPGLSCGKVGLGMTRSDVRGALGKPNDTLLAVSVDYHSSGTRQRLLQVIYDKQSEVSAVQSGSSSVYTEKFFRQ